jgi:hypothetical protein
MDRLQICSRENQMPNTRTTYAMERRPNGSVLVEQGRIGMADLAVFYPGDHQLALAVVHFLNGDMAEAQRFARGVAGEAVVNRR